MLERQPAEGTGRFTEMLPITATRRRGADGAPDRDAHGFYRTDAAFSNGRRDRDDSAAPKRVALTGGIEEPASGAQEHLADRDGGAA